MKTTKKDYERFQAEFERWRKRLGLTDWEISFYHDRLLEGRAAEIRTNLEAGFCEVYLALEHPPYPVDRNARHEAFELLLDEFDTLARYRYIRPDELDAARHRIIHRLESLFDEMEST